MAMGTPSPSYFNISLALDMSEYMNTKISSSLSFYNICMDNEFIIFQKQRPQNIKMM